MYVPGYTEEDLIQEGYLALHRATETFNNQNGVKFETYASKCVRNRIIDLARSGGTRQKAVNTDTATDVEAIAGETLEETIEHIHRRERLMRILGDCTPDEQAIIGMYLRGYNYSEISTQVGIDKKKIDNTIQKIKRMLK